MDSVQWRFKVSPFMVCLASAFMLRALSALPTDRCEDAALLQRTQTLASEKHAAANDLGTVSASLGTDVWAQTSRNGRYNRRPMRRFRRRRRRPYARKKSAGPKKYYPKTRMTTATTTAVKTTTTTAVLSNPTPQPLKDPPVWHNMSTSGTTTTTIGIGILPTGPQTGLLQSGERQTSRTARTAPHGRESHVAVMDYLDRLWIFGGDIFGQKGYFNDLFYLDTTQDPLQWVQAFPTGTLPEPRDRLTAVTDTEKKKMWIFGGANKTDLMNDVFYIDLTKDPLVWVQVAASGNIPTPRQHHVAAMDSENKMWIFGGHAGRMQQDITNEVFYLDTSKVPPEWVQVNATGYIPPVSKAAAAMDSYDRLWVMGGTLKPDANRPILKIADKYLADLFYLDTRQDPPLWVNASTSGTVLNQTPAEAIANMDSRGLLWIFGGAAMETVDVNWGRTTYPYWAPASLDSVFYLDTKQEPLAWVHVVPDGNTLPRELHAGAMDSTNRMWVFGGYYTFYSVDPLVNGGFPSMDGRLLDDLVMLET